MTPPPPDPGPGPFPPVRCDEHGEMEYDAAACWHRCAACGRTLPDEECLRLLRAQPAPVMIVVT